GNKWFGTDNGLAEYDDHNWTVYKYIGPGAQINKVTAIAADQSEKIWIGTELNLAKYDNSKWVEYKYWNSGLPANNVTLIVVDHDGNKWMLAGGIVTFFDGKTWKTYTSSNSALPDNRTLSIAIDPGGSKWFGTLDGKVIKFDGSSWTTYTLPVHGSVPAIDFDSKGNTWIGVDEAGVLKLSNNSWTIYNQANSGLPRNAVLSLAVDLSKNVWAGSYHGDLVKFNGASWTRFSEYYSTRVISVDKAGNVWIRADNALVKYDGSVWTSYTIPSGVPGTAITSIQFDSAGNKWLGLNIGGIAKFDGNNWTVYNSSNSGIVSNTIYTVAIDPADNKWIGSYYGLSVFREGGVILVMPPAAPRLVSAANHSKDQPLSLRLSWNKSEGAETYHLQLAKDSLFKNLVINDSALFSLSRDVTGLLNSTTYYWRVRAKASSGISPWSEVWSFSTIQALAKAPVLSLPKNNSTDNPLTLKLLWRANKNTDRYRLIVAGDDKFTNIIFHDSTLTDTLKEVKDLKEGMKYYWKVCSGNSAGEGPFSEVWKLITILYAPGSLGASVQDNKKINLTWKDKSENETGYVIERKQSGDFTPIDTVKASITSYTDSKVSQASTYLYRIKAYTPFAVSAYSNTVSVTLTGVDELALIPKEFRLFQNYPNPFNPSTIISYTLPVESSVRLIIYNSLGETLKELTVKNQNAGLHEISFDARSISSGVYFYILEARGTDGTKDFRQIKKMIILK
ncbi:MAG: T9SS type A sorting domain-containing protein, partial [Bacillota bacterium]